MVDGGIERVTTTRVAERAGVSVGSLYRYSPNQQSLLAALLERYLLGVVEAVERLARTWDVPVHLDLERRQAVAESIARDDLECARFTRPQCVPHVRRS
ncbi:hypothetical protein AAW51_4076 [Caldimonas brevitalea]|uniref:HTH tetR-type domain-containing protein n=1 Tax=Caldimonas brevitalea TaxID=413882 RepID=A0A0G3BN02_9BURK|nr:hypothetical protein AAW51_4076 [Caldimonas brevitalea]